jgi:HEPN domain-containing protein
MSDIKLVQEWFKYSENDLISGRHLFRDLYPKQIEIACYLSQQCAEKALKGYLLFRDTEPPRIHNLVELCQLCMNYDDTFSAILDACSDLTPYGVAIRYPNELVVDDEIAQSALSKAYLIYNFCALKIPEIKNDKKIDSDVLC